MSRIPGSLCCSVNTSFEFEKTRDAAKIARFSVFFGREKKKERAFKNVIFGRDRSYVVSATVEQQNVEKNKNKNSIDIIVF